MNLRNGWLVGAAGVLLAMASLAALGLSSSRGALGLATDVGVLATVEISADKTEAALGESVTLTITVTDVNGNPVANTSCALGLVSQPGISADVSPDQATTDANGQLTGILDVGENPGTVTVQVWCGSASAVLSVTVGGAGAGAAAPPASLPQSGAGYLEGDSQMSVLFMALLGALGLALLGTGAMAARSAWRARN